MYGETVVSFTGGGRIGSINATWPFVSLKAESNSLEISSGLIGKYTFNPDQVVELANHTVIPVLGWGVKIVHNREDVPDNIIFWSFESPETVIGKIKRTGFMPSADRSSMPAKHGFPIKWQVILLAVLVWNALLLIDFYPLSNGHPKPGLLSVVALSILFICCIATRIFPEMQKIILKPGRSVNEIKPLLNLLTLISGLLMISYSTALYSGVL